MIINVRTQAVTTQLQGNLWIVEVGRIRVYDPLDRKENPLDSE